MILDGVGLNDDTRGNAFELASKPNIDNLLKKYPNSRLKASGEAVGLPDGQMGNSEVGHTNIGAGRVIYQELTRITKEIKDGDFFQNEALLKAVKNAKKDGRALHLIGLLSDGGVHSHQNHLYALLELAKKYGLENVYVHAILDGRDTSPMVADKFVEKLENKMAEIGVGKIATVSGRYYAMDRDKRWDRVQLAYDAVTAGKGDKFKSALDAVKSSYKSDIFDEFVKPAVIVNDDNQPVATIHDDDSVIYFNFRPDRSRQLTYCLVDDNFNGFDREVVLRNLCFVTMTRYDQALKNVEIAYKPQTIENTFGEYISDLGYTQLRVAETEKYAHVTYYFDGGKDEQFKGEDRISIASPKVATYDLKPEMSAYEITEKVIEAIKAEKHDVIIINFANGDMVGHTGKLEETILAVETLDICVGNIINSLEKVSGEAVITADHGNCEFMIDLQTGILITSHSTSDVPIIIVSDRVKSIENGRLCDIAPTMLTLMSESIPIEMTGKSIIELK
jgi:2,3-bisphosphoglycerate-independent phosphoglycerate mutase